MKADQGRKQWLGAMISEAENSGLGDLLFELASRTALDVALATGGTYTRSMISVPGGAPSSLAGFEYKPRKQRAGFDRDERPMVTWGRRMPDEEATGRLQMGEEGGRQGTLESRWARTDCH
ncbi:hypothetical protein TIFTF001_014130 [Ficus carica]|uniref:Uncharacterized protein n=1 Tax=Ficus carica TaxID=3494 RepID=A0AA88A262_FICCA|nr:hypothetical protein TIFTF001_014130 [Ficus carica]